MFVDCVFNFTRGQQSLTAPRSMHLCVCLSMGKKNSNRKYVIQITISRSFKKSVQEMFRAFIFLTLLMVVRLVAAFSTFGFDVFLIFLFTKTH